MSFRNVEMGQVKEINIKNQTYCFFDDVINIKNFHSNLLKIDKISNTDTNYQMHPSREWKTVSTNLFRRVFV